MTTSCPALASAFYKYTRPRAPAHKRAVSYGPFLVFKTSNTCSHTSYHHPPPQVAASACVGRCLLYSCTTSEAQPETITNTITNTACDPTTANHRSLHITPALPFTLTNRVVSEPASGTNPRDKTESLVAFSWTSCLFKRWAAIYMKNDRTCSVLDSAHPPS